MSSLISKHTLNDFQLLSVLAECEMIINSRPLVPVSTDVDSLEAITPNHLLLQRGPITLPPGIFTKDDQYHRLQWKKIQFLTDQFWKKFISEYVPIIQTRQKWNKTQRNIMVGDLVILVNSDLPRGKWEVARITEVFPGRDGLVRSARVKTATSSYLRPITKMCLLESAQENCGVSRDSDPVKCG